MEKYKNYWHSNEEIPDNGSCVLWKAKLFSKELGNIEGGRYDQYYDSFCGTASLFVNRRNIKQWIYCKDVFDILEQNDNLQAQLDREIKINRKMKRVLEKYVLPENYEGGMGREYENMCYECKQVLKEIDNKE